MGPQDVRWNDLDRDIAGHGDLVHGLLGPVLEMIHFIIPFAIAAFVGAVLIYWSWNVFRSIHDKVCGELGKGMVVIEDKEDNGRSKKGDRATSIYGNPVKTY